MLIIGYAYDYTRVNCELNDAYNWICLLGLSIGELPRHMESRPFYLLKAPKIRLIIGELPSTNYGNDMLEDVGL